MKPRANLLAFPKSATTTLLFVKEGFLQVLLANLECGQSLSGLGLRVSESGKRRVRSELFTKLIATWSQNGHAAAAAR